MKYFFNENNKYFWDRNIKQEQRLVQKGVLVLF